MKASIVCPTYQREAHMRNLIRCFQHQTYPDCELLIFDDSPAESSTMREWAEKDDRIRYFHSAERISAGEKTNRLIEAANGEIIVNFDDDDFYSPQYVATMIDRLGENDLVKLSGWFGYSVRHRFFCYWDTEKRDKLHFKVSANADIDLLRVSLSEDTQEGFLWGYGYTYVYRKHVHQSVKFPDNNFGYDIAFCRQMIDKGFKLHYFPDEEGLVLHIVHYNNASSILPQYYLPQHLMPRYFGEGILKFCHGESA